MSIDYKKFALQVAAAAIAGVIVAKFTKPAAPKTEAA